MLESPVLRPHPYLTDPDEYRAITRNLLHTSGQLHNTPAEITIPWTDPTAPESPAPSACSPTSSTTPQHYCPGTHAP